MKRYLVWVSAALFFVTTAWALDVDQSSPKQAAISFAKALEAGDSDAAKKLVIGSDQEKQIIDGYVEFTSATKKLREAVTKRFPDKADEVLGPGMSVDPSKALENAEVKEEGDTATILKPGDAPMALKRSDGKWVIDLTQTLKPSTQPALSQNLDQTVQMLKSWAGVYRETAGEIDEGKYTAPAEASEALKVKLMAVIRGSTTAPTDGAATQPTQPGK